MKIVGLDEIKRCPGALEFTSGDVVVLNKEKLPFCSEAMKLDCFLVILCTEGELLVRINTKIYELSPQRCAFILPNSIVQPVEKDETLSRQAMVIAFSSSLLDGALHLKKEMWKMGYHLYKHPILSIDENKSYKSYLYRELLINLLHEPAHLYSKEILHYIFLAAFCEIMAEAGQAVTEEKGMDLKASKGQNIFQKFMEAVMSDDGTHRSVNYYADLLCYSSKHLSTVVKTACGKSPLRVINDHAMEQIKYVLKHTDLSMREISDKFEFSNPSFFGKFVKGHIGISPQQYRHSNIE